MARHSRYGNSGMTKKHFVAIAETLSSIPDRIDREREVDRWIPTLRAQNPRFDSTRFRDAVESMARKKGHGNRRRSSRWGDDGPAPAPAPAAAAPAAGNRRRGKRAKRNARTGKFTRRG